MKFALLLTLVLLVGMTSAETVSVGNYSIEFNISKPHIIEDFGESIPGSNTTVVKTFDGYVAFQPRHLLIEVPEKAGLVGHIYVDGTKGEMGEFYKYKDVYILNCAHWFAYSTMQFQDTLDFIESLKSVEKSRV